MAPPVVMLLLAMLIGASDVDQQAPESPLAVQSPSSTPTTPPPAPPSPSTQSESPRRLVPVVSAMTLFDTNLDHDSADLDSYGMVLGAGGVFKNNLQKPTVELQYLAGFHRYANTDRWNRISHYLRASWERRLHKRVVFEPVTELSIKGSSEDRDLSNQFVVSPRLEYRFTTLLRLRGIAVWRVRRYDDTPDRNAFNRYAGIELLGRPSSGLRWTVGGRYELNATAALRQRYLRTTAYGDLSVPLTRRDHLEIDATYRRRHYPARLIDVAGGPDVLRRDIVFEPGFVWLHAIDDRRDMRAGYAFSGQDSNDARRDYRSHQLLFGIVSRW